MIQRINHLNLEEKIGLKEMMNHEEIIMIMMVKIIILMMIIIIKSNLKRQ